MTRRFRVSGIGPRLLLLRRFVAFMVSQYAIVDIRNFSTIAAPLTDCFRKGKFYWGKDQDVSFALLKEKLSSVPILAFLNFEKLFEVQTDACMTGIRAALTQVVQPIKFFSEKFNEAHDNGPPMSKNFLPLFVLFIIGNIT